MSFILSNEGEVRLIETAFNKESQEDLKLKLFTNDVTPSDSSTVASFTEATESGYSESTLTGSNWAASTSAGVTTAIYNGSTGVDFTFNEAVTIYGYFITSNDGTVLIGAERNRKDISDSGTIKVKLNITID